MIEGSTSGSGAVTGSGSKRLTDGSIAMRPINQGIQIQIPNTAENIYCFFLICNMFCSLFPVVGFEYQGKDVDGEPEGEKEEKKQHII